MQPQHPNAPHWSPDGFWWWDGTQWVPAAQARTPGGVPPAYYPMPPPLDLKPSPGLRPFLIVVLAIDVAIWGFMTLFATAGEVQGFSEGQSDPGVGYFLWAVFSILFALAVAGLVGVIRRSVWARWVALAAGIASCFTCLGLVIGIPIIVAAARAPLRKPAAT